MNCEKYAALLVAYPYLDKFLKNKHLYYYRDWVMDSGAFSAYNSGITIILDDYIAICKEMLSQHKDLTEIYSLDDIKDWRKTKKNTEEMWRRGVEAIPCFHFGEPWDVLKGYARDYPKIALGGIAKVNKVVKKKWTEQCFARVWPKKIHGFAYGTETIMKTFPFHSTDATNWELRPRKFGLYDSFGIGSRIPVRGGVRNLRPEIERYLEIENECRKLWTKEMKVLGCDDKSPTIRLSSADGLHFCYSGYGTIYYEESKKCLKKKQ